MTTTASSSNITPRKIRVIGVPLDLGQSRRGVDMGPSAVRVAGLEARLEALGHEVEDGGNVAVAIPEQKKEGDTHAKYLKAVSYTHLVCRPAYDCRPLIPLFEWLSEMRAEVCARSALALAAPISLFRKSERMIPHAIRG